VGLARGSWLDALGLDPPRPVAALGEAAAVVSALLRGDRNGVAGALFSVTPGTSLRFPVRRPAVPLLIGTWGRQAGALAGRIADEVKVGGSANPEMVGVMRGFVAAGAEQAGRDPGAVGIVLGAVTVVDEDGTAARARARSEVAMYLDVVAELDPTVDLPAGLLAELRAGLAAGDQVRAGRAIPDDVLDRFAFSGTPERVAALANAVIAAGAARVDFGTPHGLTDEGGVALLCRRVLPLIDRCCGGGVG
jgi:5,10-methylenetetrahydromethanopterin reductase